MIHQRIIHATEPLDNAWMHKPFGRDPREIIEELRSKRGFVSVRALALAAGIPQPTLSRYLSGQSETMEVEKFRAIAAALQVTLSELLGEVPFDPRPDDVRVLEQIMRELDSPQREALLAAGKAMVDASRRQR